MDTLTKEQRRKTMQAIQSRNSKIEKLLGRALWSRGYRYRKNNRTVFGCPDFTFKQYKIAIFCDSEFWHGFDWQRQIEQFKENREFWIKKIERNINRDREVNKYLVENGWVVLRFWGNDILNNASNCVQIVSEVLQKRRAKKLTDG